jgi:hypothetical protein
LRQTDSSIDREEGSWERTTVAGIIKNNRHVARREKRGFQGKSKREGSSERGEERDIGDSTERGIEG